MALDKIKIKFVASDSVSESLVTMEGYKPILYLTLQVSKSWNKVIAFLCEKWPNIPQLNSRLSFEFRNIYNMFVSVQSGHYSERVGNTLSKGLHPEILQVSAQSSVSSSASAATTSSSSATIPIVQVNYSIAHNIIGDSLSLMASGLPQTPANPSTQYQPFQAQLQSSSAAASNVPFVPLGISDALLASGLPIVPMSLTVPLPLTKSLPSQQCLVHQQALLAPQLAHQLLPSVQVAKSQPETQQRPYPIATVDCSLGGDQSLLRLLMATAPAPEDIVDHSLLNWMADVPGDSSSRVIQGSELIPETVNRENATQRLVLGSSSNLLPSDVNILDSDEPSDRDPRKESITHLHNAVHSNDDGKDALVSGPVPVAKAKRDKLPRASGTNIQCNDIPQALPDHSKQNSADRRKREQLVAPNAADVASIKIGTKGQTASVSEVNPALPLILPLSKQDKKFTTEKPQEEDSDSEWSTKSKPGQPFRIFKFIENIKPQLKHSSSSTSLLTTMSNVSSRPTEFCGQTVAAPSTNATKRKRARADTKSSDGGYDDTEGTALGGDVSSSSISMLSAPSNIIAVAGKVDMPASCALDLMANERLDASSPAPRVPPASEETHPRSQSALQVTSNDESTIPDAVASPAILSISPAAGIVITVNPADTFLKGNSSLALGIASPIKKPRPAGNKKRRITPTYVAPLHQRNAFLPVGRF